MTSEPTTSILLYGGPLDGHTEPKVPAHSHTLVWEEIPDCVYSYCPHATAAISAQRHLPVTVFIHAHIEHDAFDPSLRDHLNNE